jgi:hypothetical protein
MEDYYNITKDDIINHGGSFILLHENGGSLFRTMKSIYPEFEWHPWRQFPFFSPKNSQRILI